jgi:hypothetical protein
LRGYVRAMHVATCWTLNGQIAIRLPVARPAGGLRKLSSRGFPVIDKGG